MNIASIFKVAAKFATDHGPEITTALSVAGSINTAVLSARAAIKSNNTIVEDKLDNPPAEPRTTKEQLVHNFKLTWKDWVFPAVSGGVTIGLIICSNRLSVKRQAVVASALASAQAYIVKNHEVIAEVLDDEVVQDIKQKVAEKHVQENPPTKKNTVIVDGGEVTFLETLSMRYFKSTRAAVENAVNQFNKELIDDHSASINDFYTYLGLDDTAAGELLGWNTDELLEISFGAELSEDNNSAVIAINYDVQPKAKFNHFR